MPLYPVLCSGMELATGKGLEESKSDARSPEIREKEDLPPLRAYCGNSSNLDGSTSLS